MSATSPRHESATARAQAVARQVHGVEPPTPIEAAYAGAVTRIIAFALDAALINVVALLTGGVVALVVSVLPESQPERSVSLAVGGTAFVVWVVAYFLTFWTTTGQTPGNRVMRIRVERVDGARLRLRDALVRIVGVVLSAPLLIGFAPILVTDRRRGLHDWLAGTVVTASGGGDHPGDARPTPGL